MNRRTLLRGAAGSALWLCPAVRQTAAAAAVTTPLAAAGLPRLTVALDDAGYRVDPASVPEGWVLLALENRQAQGDNSADVLRVPDGETADSVLASLAGASAGPPPWVATATFAGAPWVPAGSTAEAAVRLEAGEWLLFNPVAPLAPARLTVAAATPTAPPSLTPAVTVDLREFAFVGLDKPIPAGPAVWHVANTGKQPHLMVLSRVPDDLEQAAFMAGLTAALSGTPGPVPAGFEQVRTVGGCGTLSPGQEISLGLDLAAGTYEAACFFPDLATGAPHMTEGMLARFVVA